MEIIKNLFINWDLALWADILQVIGAVFAFGAFIIGLFLKSEINKIKTSYIFDKRIKDHIKELETTTTQINNLLNNYDYNRDTIRTELAKCQSELEDIVPKLGYRQSWKCKSLIRLIKNKKDKPLVKRIVSESVFKWYLSRYFSYQTSYDDIWRIYNRLIEIIRQLENIKKNKSKTL